MIKKAHFSEIIFGEEYYIGGVDIFSESPARTLLKTVNLKLSVKVSYETMENVPLYLFKIKGKKFRLAIKEVSKNIHIISYLSGYALQIAYRINDGSDYDRNHDILTKSVLENVREYLTPEKNMMYSRDFMRRFVLAVEDGCVKVWEESFCINEDITIDFPADLNRAYTDSYYYVRDGRLSIYATLEDAVKDITKQL